jgi:ribosomal protein L11 methyltransferase
VKREIYRIVAESVEKLPVRDLVKKVSRHFDVEVSAVRKIIDNMVGEETLVYTNRYGTSFLELSLERPVRVSRRLIIKPPRKHYVSGPEDVVIEMEKGAAFGEGSHPTTRLVLEALDVALPSYRDGMDGDLTGLDIGTGTGILAIALAKLGIQTVLGTDLDPCAVSEARANVMLNGLESRVTIFDRPLEKLDGGYFVILANLAWPTIKNMASRIVGLAAPGGLIILSGFRTAACPSVYKTFQTYGAVLEGKTSDHNWACTTWRKPALTIDAGFDRK